MNTQSFQLDPSLAGLSPALLKKRYDQLTPEERRALGLTRLATDQEVANAPQAQPQGAPADFGGPVLPNPNGIQVSADTDPGGEPTRLPNGATFQKQNFSGAMPEDVSNPPQAQVTAPAMQTVGAKFDPALPYQKATFDPNADYQLSDNAAKDSSSTKSDVGFWDDPKAYLQNRAKDLQDASQHQTNLAMGPESEGKPFYERLGHRLLSLAPETAAVVDKMVAGGMDWKNAIAIASGFVDPAIPAAYFGAHGAAQLTGVEPGIKAGDTSPENVQNALLAGSAVAGAGAAAATPRAGTTVDLIKQAKTATPKQAAQAVGATAGAVSGHGPLSAPGAYYGAKTAGKIAETVLGKERANQPILKSKPVVMNNEPEEIPAELPEAFRPAPKPYQAPIGSAENPLPKTPAAEAKAPAVTPGEAEEFEGVTSPQTEHAAATESEAAAAETPESLETPAATLTKKASPADLEKALNDALGGKPLQRGVPLKNQAAAAALPEGFTPVESSLLKGYKYDPAAREFSAVLKNGQSYVHGDVSPEAAKAFKEADSQGSAWTKKIRQGPGHVLIEKNGEPVVPATVTSSTGEVIGKSEAGMQDMDPALAAKVANLKDFMNQEPAKAVAKPAKTAAAKPVAADDDLTSLLQQSVDHAPGKGGVFTSVEPKALLERWGVDPESFVAGREQTRGLSPEDSAASIKKLTAAYKRGQVPEPVLETRDVNNNIIDVDGRGRALAAHKAGIERIPIIVRRMQ